MGLSNVADPVWSVNIMVALCVLGATYTIFYILKLAADELNNS